MTIGYTTGVYDLFHIGHLNLLKNAKGMCDKLIVGVTVDELVAYKGKKALIPFEDRIALMRAIKGPDLVIPQHSLDHHDKVKKLKFDVFVVGDDWVGKYDYLEEQGVTVVYTPYGKGTSSTSLKKKIHDRFEKMKKKTDNHLPMDAVDVARKRRK